MKYVLFSLALVLSACKEDSVATEVASVPTKPTSKPIACAVSKSDKLAIKCDDGTTMNLDATPAPSVAIETKPHIRDAGDTEYPTLAFIGQTDAIPAIVLNRLNGRIFNINNDGYLMRVPRIYFDAAFCTGHLYIADSQSIVKNKVLQANIVSPVNTDAFQVIGYVNAAVHFYSYFESGVCTATSLNVSHVAELKAINFDSTDPRSLMLPIEIVGN